MRSTLFLMVFILFFILIIRLFFYYQERVIYKEGDDFKITYSFNHEPKKNAFGQYFYIGDVMVSAPLYPKYNYGEKVDITGAVTILNSGDRKILVVKNPEIVKIKNNNPVFSFFGFIRQRVDNATFSVLPGREAGLLIGIILGVRDRIDSDFYKELKGAGVLHVIAASGQNVSILASLLLVTFERFVKRRHAILFTGLGILVYSGITGFDPPIIRASIMAFISYGAMAYGKQNTGILGLLLTAWGMVLLDPSMLGNVSFQLSFLSTFGIMTLKPILDRVVSFKLLKILKDDITTTFSAQIATLPLMLAVFGSYSLISLPVNILVLWTIPILMVFGGIGSLLSLVSPILATPFILLAYPFLAYFSGVIDLAQQFSMGVNIESVPTPLVIGYYLILIGIVIKLGQKKVRKS